MYVGGGGWVPEGISAILIHTKAQAIFGFDIFKNSIFFFFFFFWGGGGVRKINLFLFGYDDFVDIFWGSS